MAAESNLSIEDQSKRFITDAMDRLSALGRAAETPEIREEIIQTAMNMCIEPNQIELTTGRLAMLGMAYVGTLPPPKSEAARDGFEPLPQLLCRVEGDDMDRALSSYKVKMPVGALEIYLEWMEFHGRILIELGDKYYSSPRNIESVRAPWE